MKLHRFDKRSENNAYIESVNLSADAKGVIRNTNTKDYYYVKDDDYIYRYNVSGSTEVQSSTTVPGNNHEAVICLNKAGDTLAYINSSNNTIVLYDALTMVQSESKSITTTNAKKPIFDKLYTKLFFVDSNVSYLDLSDDTVYASSSTTKPIYIIDKDNTNIYTIDGTVDKLIKYSINVDGTIGNGAGGSSYIEIKDYTGESIDSFVDITINKDGYIMLLLHPTSTTSRVDIISTTGVLIDSLSLNGVYTWMSMDTYGNLYLSRNDAVVKNVVVYDSNLDNRFVIADGLTIDTPGMDNLGYIYSEITGAV